MLEAGEGQRHLHGRLRRRPCLQQEGSWGGAHDHGQEQLQLYAYSQARLRQRADNRYLYVHMSVPGLDERDATQRSASAAQLRGDIVTPLQRYSYSNTTLCYPDCAQVLINKIYCAVLLFFSFHLHSFYSVRSKITSTHRPDNWEICGGDKYSENTFVNHGLGQGCSLLRTLFDTYFN